MKREARAIIELLFPLFAIFFAASMVWNLFIFGLNIAFDWHLPGIAVKPYIRGTPYDSDARIDLDNLRDFLLFEFMFGVAFVVSGAIAWRRAIWQKTKQHPKVAAIVCIAIILLSIPLVRFLAGDIQGSRLYAAIEKGDAASVESILQNYVPDAKKSEQYFFIIDNYFTERYAAVVPVLVAHGFDINAGLADTGATPLMLKMQFNAPTETIEIMLKYGASPEVTDFVGRNSLHYALLNEYLPEDHGSSEYLRFIANIKKLFVAMPGKEKELIHKPDNSGKTPLTMAKERNLADIVELFESYR